MIDSAVYGFLFSLLALSRAVVLNFGNFKMSGLQLREFYPKLFLNENTNLTAESAVSIQYMHKAEEAISSGQGSDLKTKSKSNPRVKVYTVTSLKNKKTKTISLIRR